MMISWPTLILFGFLIVFLFAVEDLLDGDAELLGDLVEDVALLDRVGLRRRLRDRASATAPRSRRAEAVGLAVGDARRRHRRSSRSGRKNRASAAIPSAATQIRIRGMPGRPARVLIVGYAS